MKKIYLSLFIAFLFALIGCFQTSEIKNQHRTLNLNLNFEHIENGYPIEWEDFGNDGYEVSMDTVYAKSGKFSAVIENTTGNKSGFKALGLKLPNNYKGKFIRLSGYIKTENVSEGYAGLWLRIDPQIAFDNMSNRGISGTNDWKEYEITLPLDPNKTEKVYIGGLLAGKGKMWLDSLHVTIDGKGLDDASFDVLTVKADDEFDKGSNIVFPNLDDQTIIDLELLGRIWGFLKYHHPEIAKGNYNWDYELFRFLPNYFKVINTQERDNLLVDWIKKYGRLSVCKSCRSTTENAVLKPDLSWIENSNVSTNLKSLLNKIYNARNQGDSHYISLFPNILNPNFTHENPYSNMPYPDTGFRLLSLYRYWNMIEYFYPNKHLTDKKWNTVLKEYIPKFIHAKNELEYEIAAIRVIGEINDTHANVLGGGDKLDQLRGNKFAPFKAEFIENKLVVTDYFKPEFSKEAKLDIGDVITYINGRTVESIVDSLKPYYPSSNDASMLRDISADLLRSAKNTINLKYISTNGHQTHDITTYDKEQLEITPWYESNIAGKCFKMLDGNIGYITLANIETSDIAEIERAFKDTKGIVIDIRNYPSAFVPFTLGSFFASVPTDFVVFTHGNPDNPGEFSFRQGAKIQRRNSRYTGKLIVLVNEKTQSQAEYTAMAFRAIGNSKIVGSTTAGADGDISSILLPGGLSTFISGIGVYYPDGGQTQRIGIVPDITVNPTINGIKNKRDEVLQKAIELVNQ